MQLSHELKARLLKQRRRAVMLYFPIVLIEAALITWLCLCFNTATQVAFMFFEGALIAVAILLYKKGGIKGVFSKTLYGTVKDIKRFTEHTKIALYSPMTHIEVALLQVEFDDILEEIRLPSVEHAAVYKVGDRVCCSRAFKTPLLISQDAERIACPYCGTIYPTEKSTRCPFCDLDNATNEASAK